MKIIDKVLFFDYLMELIMIITMICGQIILAHSLISIGYISIHVSFIIYCLFYFLPILYLIALWNSDVINYQKNTILLILLFVINEVVHGNQVQLAFPLPAIDFYVIVCLIINVVFFIKRKTKNNRSKIYL